MVIKKDMSVLDVLLEHPESERVFKTYEQRTGHCICCNSLFETIESISVKYGLDIDALIKDLREAVRSKNA
ncbi:MAG TPA: hypothetical protein ENN34_09475 [Deltaproteobacteria bacterium]|nr:hypothetical protein [Deltaproteobacteria bacterium]